MNIIERHREHLIARQQRLQQRVQTLHAQRTMADARLKTLDQQHTLAVGAFTEITAMLKELPAEQTSPAADETAKPPPAL